MYGSPPVSDRHRPFFGDVADRQVENLENSLIVGKQSPVLDDFAEAVIERLDRIGRVNDLPDLFRELKHGNNLRPVRPPGFGDQLVLAVPFLSEQMQLALGLFGGRRAIDQLQVRRDDLPVFLAHQTQRMSHQMNDAQLHHRFGKDAGDRLRKAFQPVDACDQDIFHPAILQLGDHAQPEFGSFVLRCPQTKHFFVPLYINRLGHINCSLRDSPFVIY